MGDMRNACNIRIRKPKERDYLRVLNVDEIIFKWIVKKCVGMNWIQLAQSRVQGLAVANATRNVQFSIKDGGIS
jgi:hypothetical protein